MPFVPGAGLAKIEAFLAGRELAPRLLAKLRAATLPEWFTRRGILQRDWSGFSSPGAVGAALRFLAEGDFLESDKSPTGGRPTIRYRLARNGYGTAPIAPESA